MVKFISLSSSYYTGCAIRQSIDNYTNCIIPTENKK